MPATRLRTLSKAEGFAVLAALVLFSLALLIAAAHYTPPHWRKGARGDAYLYQHIIERMKAGESYYQAAHKQLRAGGYGTRSVFNWRTPLYATWLSLLPRWQYGRYAMFVLCCLATLCIMKVILDRWGFWAAVPVALALAPVITGTLSHDLVLFTELPGGLLIFLGIGLYALGRRKAAIASAVLALFIRALAAPAVLVLAADALQRRRKSDVWLITLGLVGYCLYFAWHAHMVALTLTPSDTAYRSGWVQFGGFGFVLSTAHANGLLWLLPLPVTAIALPLSVLGLAAWPTRAGALAFAIVAVYLAGFMVVGKHFDNYWGVLYSPLLSLGLGCAPAALFDLWRVLTRRCADISLEA